MTELIYQDPQVEIFHECIIIHKYFFPLATTKTILFSQMEKVALVDSEGTDHTWGICGKHLNNWFPYDSNRKHKKHFIEIQIKGEDIKPSITPDNPELVFQIIWENHTKEGIHYKQEKIERLRRQSQEVNNHEAPKDKSKEEESKEQEPKKALKEDKVNSKESPEDKQVPQSKAQNKEVQRDVSLDGGEVNVTVRVNGEGEVVPKSPIAEQA